MIKLIWSQDELLAAEAVEELAAAMPEGAEIATIDGGTGIDGLEEAVYAGSLFATERLVVLREAQVLKKADVQRLSDVLSRDTVPSEVAVVAVSERVPSALLDALKGLAEVVRLTRPRRGELVNWVTKRIKRAGLLPGRDAAAGLVEALGDGLRELDQAIGQLGLRIGKGATLERAHVLEHFTAQAEQPVWLLFDAVVKHEGTKAFEILRRVMTQGNEGLPLLGALVSQVRGIMRTKSLLERSPHLREGEVAKALGVSEGRAAVMRRQASRLSWEWLLSVHRLLAQADFELKGGEDGAVLPPGIVLERVVAGALEAS